MALALPALLVLSVLAAPTVPGPPPASAPAGSLAELLANTPADSLVAPLRNFEARHGRDSQGGEAAIELGRLYYARGEYLLAATSFQRASVRLAPARRLEARYWGGLATLAIRQPEPARILLEEVATSASPRAREARFALALAWEQEGRPDRAYEELERLLARDPGEAGPPALERLAALAERLHRPEAATRARARLVRDYPRSLEAARALTPPRAAPRAPEGAFVVQIGVFSNPARARALVNTAHRAGFPRADMMSRGESESRVYVVRVGRYATPEEARAAGEEVKRKLGLVYHIGAVE
jgi:tetratricopeptide (TPR) repeat protein